MLPCRGSSLHPFRWAALLQLAKPIMDQRFGETDQVFMSFKTTRSSARHTTQRSALSRAVIVIAARTVSSTPNCSDECGACVSALKSSFNLQCVKKKQEGDRQSFEVATPGSCWPRMKHGFTQMRGAPNPCISVFHRWQIMSLCRRIIFVTGRWHGKL